MYKIGIKSLGLCVFSFWISACSWQNDPEMKTQGNLDGIHYPTSNPGSNYKEESVFTPQEQEPQNIITSNVKLLYIRLLLSFMIMQDSILIKVGL